MVNQTRFLRKQNEQLFDERKMRIELEEELNEIKKQFHIIADNVYNWESWKDTAGHILYVSPAFERVTGYLVKDYIEKPHRIKKIVHPHHFQKYREHLSHEFENTREVFDFKFKIITQNNEEKLIRHICKPVYDNNGNYMGRRGTNIELTGGEN